MSRADLRPVEFSITKKVVSKKSKKSSSAKVKCIGYFHIWGTDVDKKGKEIFFGLVEDANTGNLLEVSYKSIRFLSDYEVEDLYSGGEDDEAPVALAAEETALEQEAEAGAEGERQKE